MVQIGAHIDVAGRGVKKVGHDALTGILRTYPRLDFALRMRREFLDEARRQPRGSFARVERTIRVSERFTASPIDRLR